MREQDDVLQRHTARIDPPQHAVDRIRRGRRLATCILPDASFRMHTSVNVPPTSQATRTAGPSFTCAVIGTLSSIRPAKTGKSAPGPHHGVAQVVVLERFAALNAGAAPTSASPDAVQYVDVSDSFVASGKSSRQVTEKLGHQVQSLTNKSSRRTYPYESCVAHIEPHQCDKFTLAHIYHSVNRRFSQKHRGQCATRRAADCAAGFKSSAHISGKFSNKPINQEVNCVQKP